MYLKWVGQVLQTLSLESSYKYDMSHFDVYVVGTHFIEKNIIASTGIERDT